ncbi:MAG: methionyl-tRNA formyltransferase [Candidatus Doudnabacteria bacterium]|nr:methionyl-tRNA formyltransferase [Candidatus Doudnabacteria bacterium]
MKIIFFGTSNVALPILEALSKKHEIVAVVTSPDAKVGRKQELKESPVSVLATEMKLKLLKPVKVKGEAGFVEELSALGADMFVVVSYGKILPLQVINLPKYKTVNVHFSPLPKYRGPSPIQAALQNGDEYTGSSVFILDEKVDNGPLLSTEIIKIDSDDNYLTLSQKLAYKAAGSINQVLEDYVTGKTTPLPQDEASATYTKIISKTDGQIDWNKSAYEIYNQFRAFFPWPGVWTRWNGKVLKIIDLEPALKSQAEPGSAKNCGLVLDGGKIACGQDTFLWLKMVQLEGKKETLIQDFLNGYSEFVGSELK